MKNTRITKIVTILLGAIIAAMTIMSSATVFAATKATTDAVFPKFTGTIEDANGEISGTSIETYYVEQLPRVTAEQVVASAIKTVLKWSMLLTIISIVVAAIFYIMSLGKEEDLTKARNIILYLIVGMAIMSASYGIITGLSRFNFFSAPLETTQTANK